MFALLMENITVARVLLAWILFYLVSKLWVAARGPLRDVPGPRISLFTNLVLKYYVLTGRRALYIDAMHKRYGPVVRVSPLEVAVSDPTAVQQIHKISSGFYKSEFYRAFVPNPEPSAFSMTNPLQHRERRKLLARGFADACLAQYEGSIRERINVAVKRMTEDLQNNGKVDVLKWWTMMTTDVISKMAFGETFGMLEKGQKNQYSLDLEKAGVAGVLLSEFPPIGKFFRALPARYSIGAYAARRRLNEYGESAAREVQEREASGKGNPTIFSKICLAHEKGGLNDAQVNAEASSAIVAGTDTTATTLSYMTWLLAIHPQIQQKLSEEVNSLDPDFTDVKLKELPLLNHVIEETLRLYGAVQGSLPRRVPDGGRTLAGYFVPGGLTVLTQAYTMQRNPLVFPNPDKFDPSRWEQPTKEMKANMLAFGGGSRTCLGEHLARMEMRGGIATLFRTLPNGLRVAFDQNGGLESNMKFVDKFLISPASGDCMLASM